VKAMDCWDVAAKSIWKSKAPIKVCFFARAASEGKIPTKDKLKRGDSSIQVDALCVWMKDFVDHLLVHYQWASYLSLMGLRWAQLSNVRYEIVAWRER